MFKTEIMSAVLVWCYGGNFTLAGIELIMTVFHQTAPHRFPLSRFKILENPRYYEKFIRYVFPIGTLY
jgi:hypothetical protein